jgi:DNA-binding response OmpR family regulator
VSYKILLLEDDKLFSETLQDFLEEESFVVDSVYDGKEALSKTYENVYDLYLLDVKVPFINGFDFLKSLRDSGDETPAIFITSLKEMKDLSRGFLVGADDYLRKPFEIEELLYRIHALLKRRGDEKIIKIDESFVLDLKRKRLYKDGEEVDLKLKDIQLLSLLLKNRGKVVTKEMILETIWTSDEEPSFGAIRVYVNHLKKVFPKEWIKNIRGIGYKFEK